MFCCGLPLFIGDGLSRTVDDDHVAARVSDEQRGVQEDAGCGRDSKQRSAVEPEARTLLGHRVVTEREISFVDTYVIRGHGLAQLFVLERDLDCGDHSFEWIGDRSPDMEGLRLSRRRCRLPEQRAA